MLNATAAACNAEVASLRAHVSTLEAQLAALQAQLRIPAEPHPGRRLQENTSAPVPCGSQQRHDRSNLVELLPSLPSADMSKFDGRCSRRYATLDSAWTACTDEPACVGVVRDNGLRCGRGQQQYELRGGSMQRGPGTAWVCAPRLQQSAAGESALVAPTAPANAAHAREGFVFIVLGACAMPNHDCKFVREVSDAIDALKDVFASGLARRPIAVVSDGGINLASLMRRLAPDVLVRIPQADLDGGASSGASKDLAGHSDQRVRKLLAYRASPFERACKPAIPPQPSCLSHAHPSSLEPWASAHAA